MLSVSVLTIKSIFAVLLICALLQNTCAAEEVSIATGEFPPLYTQKTSNKGHVLQIVQEAFNVVGVKVKFHFFPWARAERHIQGNKMDASCCWFPQKERQEHGYYSLAVYPYTYSFFHLKTKKFDWNTIEDLKGLRIGGTISYTYTKEFTDAENRKTINVRRIPSDLNNLKLILAGRIDIFPLNLDVGKHMLENQFAPGQAELVTHHIKPLVNNYVQLVFPKLNPKSGRLLNLFNKGLQALKDSGRYQEILNSHRNSNS